MKNTTKKIAQTLKIVVLALALSFGLSYVYAWTAPTLPAPNGNTSAPINTGTSAQTKSGSLTAGGITSTVDIIARENVKINSTNGGGIVGSPSYWTRIDPNGQRFIVTPTTAQVNSGANIIDIEDPANWTHRMELRADGGAYFGGNVGIGTTNPGGKLSVCVGGACWWLADIYGNYGRDSYGGWVGSGYMSDTCNGDFNNSYTCDVYAAKTCLDSIKTGSGCNRFGYNCSGTYAYRTVTCYVEHSLVPTSTAGTW